MSTNTPTNSQTTRAIVTDAAPAAVGPYSAGVVCPPFVYVSGQLPIDPTTGAFDGESAAQQADRSLRNVQAVLNAAGLGLSDVVKTMVLLADIDDFAAVNEVYARHFADSPVLPARSAFQAAALPKGALVEIEAIARIPEQS